MLVSIFITPFGKPGRPAGRPSSRTHVEEMLCSCHESPFLHSLCTTVRRRLEAANTPTTTCCTLLLRPPRQHTSHKTAIRVVVPFTTATAKHTAHTSIRGSGGLFIGGYAPKPPHSRASRSLRTPTHPPGSNPPSQGSTRPSFLVVTAKIVNFIFVWRGAEPPARGVLVPRWCLGRVLTVTGVFVDVRNMI